MKMQMVLLILCFVLPVMAAEIDSKPNADRLVADDIEIKTLPNGEVVIRLVSRSGLAARQFWTDSVYKSQGFVVIFQGRAGSTHNAAGAVAETTGNARQAQTRPYPQDCGRDCCE